MKRESQDTLYSCNQLGITVDCISEDMDDSALFSFSVIGSLCCHSLRCGKQK